MWRQKKLLAKAAQHTMLLCPAEAIGGCQSRQRVHSKIEQKCRQRLLLHVTGRRHETTLYEPLSENLIKERRDVQNAQHPTSATAKKAALKLLDHADG